MKKGTTSIKQKVTVKKAFNPERYYKISLIVIIFLATLFLSSRSYFERRETFAIGDIAQDNIVADKEVGYTNVQEIKRRRNEIIDSFKPVFDLRGEIEEQALKDISSIFGFISWANTENLTPSERYDSFKKRTGIDLDRTVYRNLHQYYQFNNYREKITTLVSSIMDVGIVAKSNIPGRIFAQMENGIVIDKETVKETKRYSTKTNQIYFYEDIMTNIADIVASNYSFLTPDKLATLTEISRFLIRENLFYNDAKTEVALEDDLRKIKMRDVTSTIKEGATVIRKGEKVTEENIEILNKLFNYNVKLFLVDTIFLVMVFWIALLYLKNYVPSVATNMKRYSLLAIEYLLSVMLPFVWINALLPAINVDLIDYAPIYLLSWIPLIAIINTMLLSKRVAIFSIFTIAFGTFFVFSESTFIDIAILIIASFSAVMIVDKISKRSEILLSGIIVGVICALGAVLDGIRHEVKDFIVIFSIQVFASLLIGFLQGILATGLLPLLEGFLDIPTMFRLHELSDFNSPLLRDLQLRAPGTFHHSFILSNMAETASKEVGANALLARVASYYHDIGKMENPQYYIENIIDSDNKHKLIKPSLSATIIKAHIKSGISMAEAKKLPRAIIDVIKEHHGTSMIKYFYNLALQQGGTVEKDLYRYPGPKPQSKESAIIMLGDAIEAASRTLVNPTALKIEELIKGIVNEKVRDGELQASGLTLKDISHIEKSFLQVLIASFHGRIKYPDEHETKKLEDKQKIKELDEKHAGKKAADAGKKKAKQSGRVKTKEL